MAIAGVPGLLLGAFCLGPVITADATSGDWRAVSEGLRRTRDRLALAAGERAVVHFHDLRTTPAAVTLDLSLRDPATPVRLTAMSGGRVIFLGPLTSQPLALSVPVAKGESDVDIFLDADAAVESQPVLYRLHSIRLRRAGAIVRIGEVAPAVVGLAVFLVLWSRGRRGSAVAWCWLAVFLAAGLWSLTVDPESALRFRPNTREAIRLAVLVGLWVMALWPRVPRVAGWVAAVGTVGLIHGPSLHYGFTSDDFCWARPWSLTELVSTLAGPEDPLGITFGSYRPLPSWTRALDYAVWGVDARGWHLSNLLLHCANALVARSLLERLGVTARGALAGSLVWMAHPLGASAASWATQRTDGLMALFYLGALSICLRPTLAARGAAATLGLGLLALASKETAVTLPVAILLAQRCAGRTLDGWRRRAVWLLGLLVLAYVVFWLSLFSSRLALGAPRGFDPSRVGDWSRALAALVAAIFLPTGYEDWRSKTLREWSPLYLFASCLLAVGPWLLASAGGRRREPARLLALAVLWPVLTVAPMLGVRLDLYRLGLLPCFGLAVMVGAVAAHVERRHLVGPALLAAAMGFWLMPIAASTSAAWGPGGFLHERNLESDRQNPRFQSGLRSEARWLFERSLERREHTRAWMEGRALSWAK